METAEKISSLKKHVNAAVVVLHTDKYRANARRYKQLLSVSRSLVEIEKLFKPQDENSDGPSPYDDFNNDTSKENASACFDT